MGGHPVVVRRSRRPHLDSAAAPSGCTRWVDTVSLGKVARSTTRTRYPFRASNIAVGEPAQRAPMTMTSNGLVIHSLRFLTIRRRRARLCAVEYGNATGGEECRASGEHPNLRPSEQWVISPRC